jgi:glycosyltransferase involved in cell wall biosynthesis
LPASISFSVVIPTYNRAPLIERAIRSALDQTRAPDEVIIIDDGSTDDTAARVGTFGPPVRYLPQPNKGVAAARNHGVREANGNWIAFLDSDDYWVADHLERIAAAIEATDGLAVMYFDDVARSGYLAGRTEWEWGNFSIAGPHQLIEDGTEWMVRARHPMMTQGVVARRDAYLAVGGSLERLVQRSDTYLWFRLCLGQPVCAVAGVGAYNTADDTSGIRLTEGRDTLRYAERTIMLYEEVLNHAGMVTPAQYRELARRLANAHLSAARTQLHVRNAPAIARHVVTSLRIEPRAALDRAKRLVNRGSKANGGERRVA